MATDSKVFVILPFKTAQQDAGKARCLVLWVAFCYSQGAFLIELDIVCLQVPFAVVLILIVSLIGLFFTLDDRKSTLLGVSVRAPSETTGLLSIDGLQYDSIITWK